MGGGSRDKSWVDKGHLKVLLGEWDALMPRGFDLPVFFPLPDD